MKVKIQDICIFFILFIGACSQKETSKKIIYDSNIVACVDTFSIELSEIDGKIKQNLYDELSRIHLLRTAALNNEIENKLLEIESIKSGIPKDSILERFYLTKINDEVFEKYILAYANKDKKVVDIKQGISYHEPNSLKGKELILNNLKEELRRSFIDSLRKINKVKIFLQPPERPSIKLDNLLVHYRGKKDSKVTMLEISDFDCDLCREYNYVYNTAYNNYKDLVRFGYTYYGSYVSSSAMACESASRQNKFWEMHDSIMNLSYSPDTSDIFRISENIGLNMDKFKSDFTSQQIYDAIENNLYLVRAAGIYGTPTVMIDNKPLFDSSSLNDILHRLEEELAR